MKLCVAVVLEVHLHAKPSPICSQWGFPKRSAGAGEAQHLPVLTDALLGGYRLAGLRRLPFDGRTYGVHQHGQMSPSKYSFSVPVPWEMIVSAGNHWAWPSRNPMLLPLR